MIEGCKQCGKSLSDKRSGAEFCGDTCRKAFDRTPEKERYLNPSIIPDKTGKVHGHLYTEEGDEIKLESGVLRVRRRHEDPAIVKAHAEKVEEGVGVGVVTNRQVNKRRGSK